MGGGVPASPATALTEPSLESRFRKVAVQLALLSHGSVARMDGNTGGGSVRHYEDRIPQLGEPVGHLDLLETRYVPHIHWGLQWAAAITDADRRSVIERAETELKRARISSGDPTKVETKAERDQRIVTYGEGLPALEVAISARCGLRDVHAARREAGRDEKWGRRLPDASGLPAHERRARVRELAGQGLNMRQIARALGLTYKVVRRDLDAA